MPHPRPKKAIMTQNEQSLNSCHCEEWGQWMTRGIFINAGRPHQAGKQPAPKVRLIIFSPYVDHE